MIILYNTIKLICFYNTLVEFHYGQVGLFDLDSSTYLASGNPVAATLATLMRSGNRLAAEVKLEALYAVIAAILSLKLERTKKVETLKVLLKTMTKIP